MKCLISFGANLGNPAEAIALAAEDLQRQLCGNAPDSFRMSRLYRTPPVGGPEGQLPFLNAVAAVDTPDSPHQVWHTIMETEQRLGRRRTRRWEARRIDLDILLYEDFRIWTPQLKIPHPRMCMRRFMLVPAMEVAADWRDPVSQWTIGQLAAHLDRRPIVIAVYTDSDHIAETREIVGNLVAAGTVSWWDRVEQTDQPRIRIISFDRGARERPSTKTGHRAPITDSTHYSVNGSSGQVRHAFQDVNPGSTDMQLPEPHLHVVFCFPGEEHQQVWEDGCVQEATWLGLTGSSNGISSATVPVSVSGPRYLLPAADPGWAAHELQAALEAICCEVEPVS